MSADDMEARVLAALAVFVSDIPEENGATARAMAMELVKGMA